MPNLDVNDARDFQALTLGSAAGLLQTLALAGRDPSKWDLLEGSYNGVLFHVFQSKSPYQAALNHIQDTGGRRKVKYKFPYKDGQTTDDLGRSPESFDIEILIHGNKYLKGMKDLIAQFNKPTPGDLVHPVRGKIKVVVESFQFLHTNEKRKAVEIRVTFIEHNFTLGDIRDFKDTSVKSALARALEALALIDKALTNITGAVVFVKSFRNQVEQALTDYKNRFGNNLSNMNKTFNTKGSSDLPGLLPVNEGGLRNPDGTLKSENFEVVSSPVDRLSKLPLSLLSDQTTLALSVGQITKDIAAMRDQLHDTIALIASGAGGQGALVFYDDILDLKNTSILAQDALEKGIASSKAQIITYTAPFDMSIREVCFANKIDVQRVLELEILNSELESVNFIPKGTLLQVPVA